MRHVADCRAAAGGGTVLAVELGGRDRLDAGAILGVQGDATGSGLGDGAVQDVGVVAAEHEVGHHDAAEAAFRGDLAGVVGLERGGVLRADRDLTGGRLHVGRIGDVGVGGAAHVVARDQEPRRLRLAGLEAKLLDEVLGQVGRDQREGVELLLSPW